MEPTRDAALVHALVPALDRGERRVLLASLTRLTGELSLAEDALQDAVEAALVRWPIDGIPDAPAAWLNTTARRRVLDRLRRRATHRAKAPALAAIAALEALGDAPLEPDEVRDDQLRLVFTCCHPALSLDAQVALTLRTVAGLETEAIAHAFLVPPATMAQRLVRAKRKIADAHIPYRVPERDELAERVDGVSHVVYLVFNEGYWATSGERLVRDELCDEALRLGRLLVALMPDEPELAGLLALMLLHDARRATRFDAAGELVLLEDQDRARWDAARIAEGLSTLERALARQRPGPFQLQAAIAALHAEARRAEDTDWPQIAALYRALLAHVDTPAVRVNAAVAAAMAHGPAVGLAALAALEDVEGYLAYHAARADLARRAGDTALARAAYARALALADNQVVARYLSRRLAALPSAPDSVKPE